MASRHLSRSAVLQTLFECDMQGTLSEAAAAAVLHRNLEDFSKGDTDVPFAENLLANVIRKKDEIDAVMVKAAPEWPLDKIAPVDRNVLRIGLYELLFGDRAEVPAKVALNEAIELGKSFGGDSAGKFVNGVLGAVYRDIGEPGKAEEKTPAPIPHESSGGAVVIARADGALSIALVKDAFGKWTLPKSACAEGEQEDAAARRAMREELGVEAPVAEALTEHEYVAHDPAEGRIARTVSYFLSFLDSKKELMTAEGAKVTEPSWFSEEELATIPLYPDLLPIMRQGFEAAKKI
jgi:N utilization substance protein B